MNAAVAAIQYALGECDGTGDSMDFLRYWNEGEFDILRRNWENIPDAVFIGADPLHPGTKAKLEEEDDPYNYACEIMEKEQLERSKRGVEIGTEGSLCDGIAWLYDRLKKLENVGPESKEKNNRE